MPSLTKSLLVYMNTQRVTSSHKKPQAESSQIICLTTLCNVIIVLGICTNVSEVPNCTAPILWNIKGRFTSVY